MKDCFDKQLPKPLMNYFNKTNTQHKHSTRSASRNVSLLLTFVLIGMVKRQPNTNLMQRNLNQDQLGQSRIKAKNLIFEYFLLITI